MQKIKISFGSRHYTGTLLDNPSARALAARLPARFTFAELNGNEKYHNFSRPLPADPRRVGQVRSGDLMLYGDNCLVLFYQTFTSGYLYTPLGHLEDDGTLADALGNGGLTAILSLM